ncbi:Transcription elongation factor A protein 1 [Dictyocoela muelleri]|nr:Transcription elongation factor A protein 1 [Dictyocoela muelleri]
MRTKTSKRKNQDDKVLKKTKEINKENVKLDENTQNSQSKFNNSQKNESITIMQQNTGNSGEDDNLKNTREEVSEILQNEAREVNLKTEEVPENETDVDNSTKENVENNKDVKNEKSYTNYEEDNLDDKEDKPNVKKEKSNSEKDNSKNEESGTFNSNDLIIKVQKEITEKSEAVLDINNPKISEYIKKPEINDEIPSRITREEGLLLCKNTDNLRNKASTLFYRALADMLPTNIDYKKTANLACQIEKYLYETGKLNDFKLVRSKYLNLKNKTNDLAERIYSGELTPERFIEMTIEEMKSESLKEEEARYAKKALYDSTMPKLEAETDIFQCSRCKQRKCSYRQLQTRSADEPMTTFVKCVCGHAWKFS